MVDQRSTIRGSGSRFVAMPRYAGGLCKATFLAQFSDLFLFIFFLTSLELHPSATTSVAAVARAARPVLSV